MAGKVVIVTGGTKGIGRAISEAFLSAGATVAICARSEPETPVGRDERQAEFHQCDIRQAANCKAFVDAVAARHGRIDVLVNNAGGSPEVQAATASPRFTEAIIGLNLLAPIHMSQAVHATMSAQDGGGAIINIASISGQRPSPGTAAYGAAKAGLLSMTRSLAQEWGPKLRVNAIVVGLIETEQVDVTYGSRGAQLEIAASIPMKRMGRGEDVAKAALFLASPLSEFITGAALDVHGGGEKPPFLDIIRRHTESGG